MLNPKVGFEIVLAPVDERPDSVYVYCLWVKACLIGIYQTNDLAEAASKYFLSGPYAIEKRMVEQ